jgi:hypothetical protein
MNHTLIQMINHIIFKKTNNICTVVEISQNVTISFATTCDCSCLWLRLGVFTTIISNFNYFGHSYNYDATIGNFILLVGWLLGLFSSMNILICPIRHNSHQISHILKVFYDDIGMYFYVCMYVCILFI